MDTWEGEEGEEIRNNVQSRKYSHLMLVTTDRRGAGELGKWVVSVG